MKRQGGGGGAEVGESAIDGGWKTERYARRVGMEGQNASLMDWLDANRSKVGIEKGCRMLWPSGLGSASGPSSSESCEDLISEGRVGRYWDCDAWICRRI